MLFTCLANTKHRYNIYIIIVIIYIYIYIYIYITQSADSPVSTFEVSHQCSSELFENWDMSTAQRAINTSHTDKQWHILFLNTRVLKLKRASNA